MRAKWTIRIERLETKLLVGVHAHERHLQPVLVSLLISGLADAAPSGLGGCLDYEPLCEWLTQGWPRSGHTALLEARVNELLDFVFTSDKRVQDVWVGMYKPQAAPHAALIGVERSATRRQYDEQCRAVERARARGAAAASRLISFVEPSA